MTGEERLQEYIKKYCAKHRITEEEARTHAVVRAAAEAYGAGVSEREGA